MNPWNAISDLIGWSLLALFFIMLAFVAVVVLGIIGTSVMNMLPKKKVLKDSPSEKEYSEEADVMGVRLYGEGPDPYLDAFRTGARWGWAYLSRH